MDNLIQLNINLQPSAQLSQIALDLARLIAKDRETVFYLDNQNYLPHLTFYATVFPTKNMDQIYTILSQMTARTQAVKLIFRSFYASWGYVGLEFKKTQNISRLHKTVVEKLNPLREGHFWDGYPARIAKGVYPAEQVEYIEKYGNPLVLNAYEPHLTLARFKDQKLGEQVLVELNQGTTIPTTQTTKLAAGETGPSGVCTKVIKSFQFRSSV